MKRPTSDLSATARLVRVVTHPTQVIRRADLRARVRPSGGLEAVSRVLLASTAVGGFTGLLLVVVGVSAGLPGVLLLGVLFFCGGMAALSFEGLLWPESELWARVRKAVGR